MKFSAQEFKELAISVLVIGFVFAWIMKGATLFRDINFFVVFLILLIAVGAAFIFHELAHKAVAQKFGCWAEYRMWDTGLIIAIFLAITVGFVFAAPGAVYIQRGHAAITRRENGLISVAGPTANLVLALLFLMLTSQGGVFALLGTVLNGRVSRLCRDLGLVGCPECPCSCPRRALSGTIQGHLLPHSRRPLNISMGSSRRFQKGSHSALPIGPGPGR